MMWRPDPYGTSSLPQVAAVLAEHPDVRLTLTCIACPEQYELRELTGVVVAYFRLRGGLFYVEVPDCGGDLVYERTWPGPEDRYKGMFDDDEERDTEIAAGLRAAVAKL